MSSRISDNEINVFNSRGNFNHREKELNSWVLKDEDRVYIYSFIRPLTCIGGLMGLFPMSKFYSKKGPEDLRYCSILYIYGLLLSTLYFATIVLAFVYFIIPSFSNLKDFNQMINFLFSALGTVTSFLCSVLLITGHSKMEKLYHKLKALDDALPTSKRIVLKSIKYCGWKFAAFFALTESLYIYYERLRYNEIEITNIRFIILSMFYIMMTTGVPTFVMLHGAGLCLCSAMIYVNLNKKIHCVLSPFIDKPKTGSILEIQEMKDEQLIVSKLEHYRNLHMKIWSFTQSTSSYLSFQLLVILTTQFLVICYNVYFGFVSLQTIEDRDLVLIQFLTAISNFILIGILTWAADVLTMQHDETSEILNWCILPTTMDNLSSCLLRFCVQVLQRKPDLNVVGLFSVNRGFLLTILGTECTYIIILIQFYGEEHRNVSTECLKNITNKL